MQTDWVDPGKNNQNRESTNYRLLFMLFHQQKRESLPTMPGMQWENINHRMWGFPQGTLEKYIRATEKDGFRCWKTWGFATSWRPEIWVQHV